MKEEKSCGCVIFARGAAVPTVLITQNKKGLHWSFPKGHVERGETEIQTAVREVREETGLAVEPYPDFTIVNRYRASSRAQKTVIYFVAAAEIDAQLRLQASEVRAARWLPLEQARETLTHENDRKILQDAANYFKTRR